MALVDEKGKLFGIINIIDLFAMILLLVLVYGTVSYVQYAERAKEQQRLAATPAAHTYRNVMATLRLDHPEWATTVHIGEQQTAEDKILATVRGINSTTTQHGDQTTYVTIELEGEMKDNVFYYQYVPLKAGQPFTVVTDQHVLTGAIVQWQFSDPTSVSKSSENTSK